MTPKAVSDFLPKARSTGLEEDGKLGDVPVKNEERSVVSPEKRAEDQSAKKKKRERTDSVATFNGCGGTAESIFRLLPRETRPALRRMLFVEPTGRCTLTDLLKGKGKTSGLLCGCRTVGGVDTPPGGHCEDHDCDPEDEDDGDEWLKSIEPCSRPDTQPQHVHIKVNVDDKPSKRRFF